MDPNSKGNRSKPQTPEAPANVLPDNVIDQAMTGGAQQEPALRRGIGPADNRVGLLFSSIHFTPANSDRVYEGRNGSTQKSVKLANVALVLAQADGAFVIPGSIYARKTGNNKPTADFSFAGSMQTKALEGTDQLSQDEIKAFRVWVASEYVTWRQKNPGMAVKKQTGPTVEDADALFNN